MLHIFMTKADPGILKRGESIHVIRNSESQTYLLSGLCETFYLSSVDTDTKAAN